jgi:hypothetical protein
MPMSDKAISVFRLLNRSPKDADGWVKTSAPIMSAVIPHLPHELIDVERNESGGGRVRLTDKGNTLKDYI